MSTELCSQQPGMTKLPNIGNFSKVPDATLLWRGIETGGRWSEEALGFIEMIAGARARDASPSLRRSAFLAWRRRWSRRMMSISCSRAFACSWVASPAEAWDGAASDFTDLFLQA